MVTTFLCTWVSVTHPNIQPYKLGGSQLERPLKVVNLCYGRTGSYCCVGLRWNILRQTRSTVVGVSCSHGRLLK
jgi:hypothetical protein